MEKLPVNSCCTLVEGVCFPYPGASLGGQGPSYASCQASSWAPFQVGPAACLACLQVRGPASSFRSFPYWSHWASCRRDGRASAAFAAFASSASSSAGCASACLTSASEEKSHVITCIETNKIVMPLSSRKICRHLVVFLPVVVDSSSCHCRSSASCQASSGWPSCLDGLASLADHLQALRGLQGPLQDHPCFLPLTGGFQGGIVAAQPPEALGLPLACQVVGGP